MVQSLKNIIVVGASGNLGAPFLSALVESKAFNVSVLSRSTSSTTFSAGVKVHRVDFTNDADLLEILKGQDAVVSAVGPTGFGDQKHLIDLAIKAGVKRFMPSEYSINTTSKAVRDLIPIFQTKWEVLEYLREKENTGLSWTGLWTGFLFDWGMKMGILGFNLQSHEATIWDDGNTRFSVTNLSTACEALVSVLQHPDETANQNVFAASFTTTQNEILEHLQSDGARDVQWKVASVTTEAQVETGRKLLETGDFAGLFLLVEAAQRGTIEGSKTDFETDEVLWNDKLGLGKARLEDSIKELLRG